jgi:dihydrolipoamide dehydrogenase
MNTFDLVIIGGGPSGYAAAMRGIDYGKKVCLIERKKIGGAGVYDGALSSKTLWEVANRVAGINNTLVHDGRDPYEISWESVQKTVNEAKLERKLQYSMHLKLLQDTTINQSLWVERGEASFVSPHEIKIVNENGEKIVTGKDIIISSGSRPRHLPQYEIDEKYILTSDGIEHIEDYPESLVIVGAGVIGCEYATIFANLGKTKVYLIDRQSRILPGEDEDISILVASNNTPQCNA